MRVQFAPDGIYLVFNEPGGFLMVAILASMTFEGEANFRLATYSETNDSIFIAR